MIAPARRRWIGRGAAILAVLVVLTGIGAGATYTGVFGARRFVVEGEHGRSEADILAAAGLAPGINVFHLDTEHAADALRADPWIATAQIDRDLPSTVVVTIVERRPIAVAAGAVIAEDGTVLPGADPGDLPTIEADAGLIDTEARTAAAAALGALRTQERRRVSNVVVARDGGLLLEMEGTLIRWGLPEEHAEKAAALTAVLRSLGGAPAAIIDVSVPTTPTVLPE